MVHEPKCDITILSTIYLFQMCSQASNDPLLNKLYTYTFSAYYFKMHAKLNEPVVLYVDAAEYQIGDNII